MPSTQKLDPSVPASVVKKIFEEQPNTAQWSDEAQWLVNPSIEARELSLPAIGTIKKLNFEYEYRWVSIGFGERPRMDRVHQLKSMGFDFASSDPKCNHQKCSCDVAVSVAEIVQDRNWIQSGDRVLMKCRADIYRGYIKRNMLSSIRQTSPRQTSESRGPSVMTTLNSMPGISSKIMDESSIDKIRLGAVLDNNSQSLEERVGANASIPNSSRRK